MSEMDRKLHPHDAPSSRRWLALALVVGLVATVASGCASQDAALQARLDELEDRVKELEKAEGRSLVRMEDVNDRLNLLSDRVETNRLGLERRGIAKPLPVVVATPSYGGTASSWSPPPYVPPSQPTRPLDAGYRKLDFDESRVSTRIAVPGTGQTDPADDAPPPPVETGPYEDVVYSEEDFQRFVDADGGGARPRSSADEGAGEGGGGGSMRRATGGARTPQPDVVHDERLPVVKVDASGAASEVAAEEAPSSPMEAYKTALASYRAGEYAKAHGQFKRYLDMGPSNDYLDNAYYWMGECSFGLGDFTQAVSWFDRVLKETPNGNKVPDSMLKAALAYARMGKPSESKGILLNLVETYPSTNAAKLATEKLKELE